MGFARPTKPKLAFWIRSNCPEWNCWCSICVPICARPSPHSWFSCCLRLVSPPEKADCPSRLKLRFNVCITPYFRGFFIVRSIKILTIFLSLLEYQLSFQVAGPKRLGPIGALRGGCAVWCIAAKISASWLDLEFSHHAKQFHFHSLGWHSACNYRQLHCTQWANKAPDTHISFIGNTFPTIFIDPTYVGLCSLEEPSRTLHF